MTRRTLEGFPADRVVALADEAFDELLFVYPMPGEATRAEMPIVKFNHNGDHFIGLVLGYGTSFEESHRDHAPGTLPRPGTRCSGCRWTDVTIMWAQPYNHDDGPTAPWQYCVVVRGRSSLPGETQRVRTTWTPDEDVVFDALNVPVPKHKRITGNERSVAGPHENALLDAALLDDRLDVVASRFERAKAGAR